MSIPRQPSSSKNNELDKDTPSYAPISTKNPSVLSLVAKDGMLQRLQDNEDESYVKGWAIRVFESKNPIVSIETENFTKF